MNIVLFGAPGAGKGTQSQFLQKEFNLKPFSMGEALRNEVTKNSALGVRIKDLIEKGQFADDEIVSELLYNRLSEGTSNIIFDGFPRNLNQIKILDDAAKNKNFKIDAVIVIDVDEETVRKRILGRYSCKNCGQIYNDVFQPTRVEGQCDICQSKEFLRRKDDTVDTLKDRFTTYKNETMPILKSLAQTTRVMRIDGNYSLDKVQNSIKDAIKSFL